MPHTLPPPYPPSPTTGSKLPFDIRAVSVTSRQTVTSAPGSKPIDRRAFITCQVERLGVQKGVAAYVRAIAAPFYNARTDVLKISLDKHPDAALNRREALEQLVSLVTVAGKLHAKHGEFRKQRRFTPYYN